MKQTVGILILLLAGTCLAADGRQYKEGKERPRSGEQSSDEGATPFSAEFGEFFEGGTPKGSGEGFGFPEDFNPDFIPYSESRNATKYVNPAATYHSVKNMPGHGRDRSQPYGDEPSTYRRKESSYRGKDDGDEGSYRKGRPSSRRSKDESYSKDDKYRKDDGETGYHRDRAYRKSDSFRKDDSHRSKGPQYRSSGDYRKEPPYRRGDGYKTDDDRPSYRSRSSDSRYRKDGPSYRSVESSSSYRKDDPEERGYKGKRPVQTMYDDWSPEDDKPSYRDRGEPEMSSEYDDSDYRERDDPPPGSYSDKEPRSKTIPTSMRPGPPYYSAPARRVPESHQRTHTTSFGVRHEYPPPPTPQTFYAPSSRKHDTSRDFHHRKGEPVPSKSRPEKEWSEFRPSPPDPVHSQRSRSREDFPQTEYSNPVPKKVVTTTQKPPNRQNCVKLKKSNTPDSSGSKYVKKMTTCYVCVDEKTGMNYEQCSYESDSLTRPFVKSTGVEDGTRTIITHRDKRDVAAVEERPSEEPSLADRAKREKDYYDSSREEGDSYKFNPDSFEQGDSEKDSSGSNEDDASSENCYKKRKGEMSCIVCQTPNKKGSYEQCSYASDPTKNKYEHSVEKVYGSPRLPESDKKFGKKDGYSTKEDDYDSSVELPSKADYPTGDYDSPGDDSSDKKKADRKTFGGGSYNFGGFGDGFGSTFGDLSGEGFDFDSIPEPAETEGQFSTKDEIFNFKPEDMEDMEMTKNIGDFGQKNRSNCKKVMKNKMTCYQCVTSKGTKNEECMYVAAAEPKSKHLSFSQVQEYRFDPHNASSKTDSDVDYPTVNFGKRKFKKYHPDLMDMKFFNKLKEKQTMEASRWPRSPRPKAKSVNGTASNATSANGTATVRREDQSGAASDTTQTAAEVEEDEEGSEEEEEEEEEGSEEAVEEEYRAVPTEPPELDLREVEKGEFHTDTEPAWDPKMGISLPRYMLERSEHEAVFDEVLASG